MFEELKLFFCGICIVCMVSYDNLVENLVNFDLMIIVYWGD